MAVRQGFGATIGVILALVVVVIVICGGAIGCVALISSSGG